MLYIYCICQLNISIQYSVASIFKEHTIFKFQTDEGDNQPHFSSQKHKKHRSCVVPASSVKHFT